MKWGRQASQEGGKKHWFYFIERHKQGWKELGGGEVRKWHDLMVAQRLFYLDTSLFEEGCVLSQDESVFRNLGEEEEMEG